MVDVGRFVSLGCCLLVGEKVCPLGSQSIFFLFVTVGVG